MRRSLLLLSVLSLLLVVFGCASEPAKTETAPDAAAPEAAAPDAADPLTGTWKGDWGPSEKDRNPVTLDLKLDGTSVTGSINPGYRCSEPGSGCQRPRRQGHPLRH
jgi:uncharacterized protein (DUF2147 family)